MIHKYFKLNTILTLVLASSRSLADWLITGVIDILWAFSLQNSTCLSYDFGPKLRSQWGHVSQSIGLEIEILSSSFSPLAAFKVLISCSCFSFQFFLDFYTLIELSWVFFTWGKYAFISVPCLRCFDESNWTLRFLAFFSHKAEWRCNKVGRNERLHIMHGKSSTISYSFGNSKIIIIK